MSLTQVVPTVLVCGRRATPNGNPVHCLAGFGPALARPRPVLVPEEGQEHVVGVVPLALVDVEGRQMHVARGPPTPAT